MINTNNINEEFDCYEEEEDESYDEAMARILRHCEEEGLNFDHEFGKYLAGI